MCEHCHTSEVLDFTIFWLDGKTEKVSGHTIAEAFASAGYGGGALGACDFYAKGDVASQWEWKEKRWQKKKEKEEDEFNIPDIDDLEYFK